MSEFFHDMLRYDFLQRSLIAGLLASVSLGVVGTFVVVRRISYIAGGIAHSILGGMGAAVYLKARFGWNWLDPMHGAVVSALLAAIIIGLVSLKSRQREDSIIGAVWAIGMALGVLFMKATPGFGVDLTSYLFGSILLVSPGDITLISLLNLVVVGLTIAFYNSFLAVCFDEEFARLRGVRVERCYLLLLCLTALTVVVLVKVVGVVLVIALLTLPVAISSAFARTLWQTMLLGIVVSALFTTTGLAVSYAPKLPAGATIIVLVGAAYLLVAIFQSLTRIRRRASVK